jgi:hypothetical protein
MEMAMRKRLPLLALAAACATPGTSQMSPDKVYRAQAEATLTSLDCSRQTASRYGYRVWYDGTTEGSLRAERIFDDGPQRSRGYITVSVPHDPGTVMYVTAERIAEGGAVPGVLNPTPRPTPVPTPVPTGRRLGPQRVSPGEVATHARILLQHCGMRVLSEQRA